MAFGGLGHVDADAPKRLFGATVSDYVPGRRRRSSA
jgi:hypothetical protein